MQANESPKPRYHRVVLKLSGQALMGEQGFGVDPRMADRIAAEIQEIHELGVQVAATVGGGNIIRGIAVSAAGMDRVSGDYMGMLATVINALALQNALEKEERLYPGPIGDRNERGRGTLHQAASYSPPGKRRGS